MNVQLLRPAFWLVLIGTLMWVEPAHAHDGDLAAWRVQATGPRTLRIEVDFFQPAADARLQALHGPNVAMKVTSDTYIDLVGRYLERSTIVTADGVRLPLKLVDEKLKSHASRATFYAQLERDIDASDIQFELLAFSEGGRQRQFVGFLGPDQKMAIAQLLSATTGYRIKFPRTPPTAQRTRAVIPEGMVRVSAMAAALALVAFVARRRRRAASRLSHPPEHA